MHPRFSSIIICFTILISTNFGISLSKDNSLQPNEKDEVKCNRNDPNCEFQHPTINDKIADLDKDGVVEKEEISAVKDMLHDIFDTDDSGGVEHDELRCLVDCDTDVKSIYNQVDTNKDTVITHQELDLRWEVVGSELSVEEVSDWLSYAVQLPQYSTIFRKNSISGYSFPLLLESNGKRLKELGVNSDLHVKQIVAFMKRRLMGAGTNPSTPSNFRCSYTIQEGNSRLAKLGWVSEEPTQHYQLQMHDSESSSWKTIYSGPESEVVQVISDNSVQVFRLASWNSLGRSNHVHTTCYASNALWDYLSWVDDIGLFLLAIFMPYRLLINGQANGVLRLLRRLPPNMPMQVTAERIIGQNAVYVSWNYKENGVDLISYKLYWINEISNETEIISIIDHPLVSRVKISNLKHGITYKFYVTATNKFGLTTDSTKSTYMFPLLSPVRDKHPSLIVKRNSTKLRNKCYICADPQTVKPSFLKLIDRRILHFCNVCDREFCHVHHGYVNHAKGLSCPAVDGQCVCEICYNRK